MAERKEKDKGKAAGLDAKEMAKVMRNLTAIGKEKGFVTETEIKDCFPSRPSSKEESAIHDYLASYNIEVVDSRKKLKPKSDDDEDSESSDESEQSSELEKQSKQEAQQEQTSDDPVRMYLREMGSIKLLTREGEVVIAKKIEKGQHEMLDILLRSELIVNYLFDLGKKLKNGKARARDIVSGLDEDDQVIEEESQAADQVLKKLKIAKKQFDDRNRCIKKLKGELSEKKKKDVETAYQTSMDQLLDTLKSINFNTKQIDTMFRVKLHHNDKIDLTFTQLARYQRDLRAPVAQVGTIVERWVENDASRVKECEKKIKALTRHSFSCCPPNS